MNESVRGLVGPSDIAEMANVSRGAVSNWRKRVPGFPTAIGGTEAKPLFDVVEIVNWLRARNYTIVADHGEKALWAATNSLRGSLDTNDLSLLVLSLCALRKQAGDKWLDAVKVTDTQLGERIAALRSAAGDLFAADTRSEREYRSLGGAQWRHIVDAIDAVDSQYLASVADSILERAARAQIKLGRETGYVGSRVASMLTKLAVLKAAPGVVYDPACGIAATLVEIAVKASGSVELFGQEINAEALAIASQRALLHGLAIDLALGDTLLHDAHPDLRADTIVLEPPLGIRFYDPNALADPRYVFGTPPKSSADLAWVQHCISHLSESGVAYVVTSMMPLSRAGAELDIRTAMLRQGCIQAVVALPGKMYQHTSIPLALWVLRTPRQDAREVLLVDGSDHADPENHVSNWLSSTTGDSDVPRRLVSISEIIADEAILTPQRWLISATQSPAELKSSYSQSIAVISQTTATIDSSLNSLTIPLRGTQPRLVTIADLVEQDVVTLMAGRAKAEDGDEDQSPLGSLELSPVVTPRGVRSRTLPFVDSGPPSSPVVNDTTLPGDVLVVALNRIGAVVDLNGGLQVGQGVSRLRIENDDLLLPEYLAGVLTGAWNNRFFSGATLQRAHIKDLEVPLLPISEQRELAAVFADAERVAESARVLAEESARLETMLRDAVRYGIPLGESRSSEVGDSSQTEGANPSGVSN